MITTMQTKTEMETILDEANLFRIIVFRIFTVMKNMLSYFDTSKNSLLFTGWYNNNSTMPAKS